MKFCKIYLLISGLLICMCTEKSLAQCGVGGPTLDMSLSTDANNTVTLEACANGDFQSSDGTDDWTTALMTLRIPLGDSNFPIMPSAPNASSDVTFVSSGNFGGITLIPQFNNPGIIVFTPSQVGGIDDGFAYIQFVDMVNAPNIPLADGNCVTLLEIDFPDSWTCNDCVEVVDSAFTTPMFGAISRTGNAGCGGDVDNYVDPFTTLPIELTAFETRTADCDVSLYWETATEQDFGYFQIETSQDGRDFVAVAQQKPASPNSLVTRRYKYAVPTRYQDHYFRLKAVDLDGSFEYSQLVFAKAPCEQDKYSMSLYPNPNFTSELMVEVNSPRLKENVQLHLTDAFGKVIRIQDANLDVGRNTIRMETEGLPSGTYYVRIIGVEQLSEPLKFIRNNF